MFAVLGLDGGKIDAAGKGVLRIVEKRRLSPRRDGMNPGELALQVLADGLAVHVRSGLRLNFGSHESTIDPHRGRSAPAMEPSVGRIPGAPSAGQRGEGRPGILHFREDALGADKQLLTGGRECDPAAAALEQAQAEFVFQCLDRVAHCGLRQVQFLRGEREAADPREGGEGEQPTTVEDRGHAGGRRSAVPGPLAGPEPVALATAGLRVLGQSEGEAKDPVARNWPRKVHRGACFATQA